MEEKYREIMEELLYHISRDIYNLLDEDNDDIVDAITRLSNRVETLSDDIMYEDEIIYYSSESGNVKYSLQ
jgi:hypothetical protein